MDLTPKNNPVREKFFHFLQNFEVLDNVYILMTFQDESIAKECALIIEKELEKSDTVKDVFIHIDMDSIMKRFLGTEQKPLFFATFCVINSFRDH